MRAANAIKDPFSSLQSAAHAGKSLQRVHAIEQRTFVSFAFAFALSRRKF
jgi:hypothetical protein